MDLQGRLLYHCWQYVGKHTASVVIYGANEHTRKLLSIVKDIPGPEIVSIVDGNTAGELCGIPVRTSDWRPDRDIGAIMVSSFTEENGLAMQAEQWIGTDRIPIIRIYNDFMFLLCADITFCEWPPRTNNLKHEYDPPKKSYIICTSERTGSSTLCNLLIDTGLAGHPEEHFNALLHKLAQSGNIDYPAFIKGFISQSATPNGVFGTKIHWFFYEEFEKTLRRMTAYRHLKGLVLINEVMPDPHFIYLTRRNIVRQAISLWKSRKTGLWHALDSEPIKYENPAYDYREIRRYVKKIKSQNREWNQFFKANRITPLTIDYEDLLKDYTNACWKVLRYIGIDVPESFAMSRPKLRKLADDFTEQCYQRYCEDSQNLLWKNPFGRRLR